LNKHIYNLPFPNFTTLQGSPESFCKKKTPWSSKSCSTLAFPPKFHENKKNEKTSRFAIVGSQFNAKDLTLGSDTENLKKNDGFFFIYQPSPLQAKIFGGEA